MIPQRKLLIIFIFSGLECVGHFFAYVTHFVFLRDSLILLCLHCVYLNWILRVYPQEQQYRIQVYFLVSKRKQITKAVA